MTLPFKYDISIHLLSHYQAKNAPFPVSAYTDQDHTKQPDRREMPKAIEHMPEGEGNARPPEHLKLGQPGGNGVVPSFLPGRNEPQVPPVRPPTPDTPPQKKKWFCRP